MPFTSQGSLSPFVKWERSWEKTGFNRQEAFPSDWTTLPNSLAGEDGHTDGDKQRPTDRRVLLSRCESAPKAFQGIWSSKRRLPVGGQLSSPLAGHTAEATAGPLPQAYGIRGIGERGHG